MTIDKTTAAPAATITVREQQAVQTFVLQIADQTKEEIGFGWVGTKDAPSTYQQLRGVYQHSVRTGEPLPISNEHCRTAIFPLESDNVAFRFWHDVSHVRLGLSFSLADELELALWHLAAIVRAGHGEDSVVYRLLATDLFSQIACNAIAGRFPHDQAQFVAECYQQGLWSALLAEIRRVP